MFRASPESNQIERLLLEQYKLDGPVREISADGAYYSEENEAYAEEQDKDIHYTSFPGKIRAIRVRAN